MVVIFFSATAFIGVRQLRIASPFLCTVQQPHKPMPHPNFAPVSSNSSRKYQSSGIDGSPSYSTAAPFTVSLGVASNHRGGTFEEILFLADGCLLHAKDQGRNRIVVAGVLEPIPGPVAMPATDIAAD